MRALQTPRLVLEPQQARHADEMFPLLCDPAIYRHENAPPPSRDWLEQRYARLESRRSPDGRAHWLNWVVRLGATGPLIGYVQATVEADGQALVAYEFNSAHWGLGYGTEAVRAMLGELAVRWRAHRARAVLKHANRRSMALLLRLDFVAGEAGEAAALAVEADERLMVRSLPA